MSSSARPWPERHADGPVPALVARAGGHEVAHAREPRERQRVPSERHTEPGELGQPAGDQRGLGVVAVAEAVRDAGGDRDHVLQRAGDLATDDVRVRVDAERLRHEQNLQHVRELGDRPTRRPRRSAGPSATSFARFGPLSTPMRSGRCSGSTSAMTSVMRRTVPCSSPFERLMTAASGAIDERAAVEHRPEPVRRDAHHDDVRTLAGVRERHGRFERVGQRDLGEVVGLQCSSLTRSTTRGSRAHSTVGRVRARRARPPSSPTSRHR